jgi:predicted NUDIX family phosphoesterase
MIAQRERVLVVPRAALFSAGSPQGLFPLDGAFFDLVRQRGFFADRPAVEGDATLKQVIPYGVVLRDDRFFLFRRARSGGDARLRGLRSVGVGGHVNPEDARDPVADALRREVEEELRMPAGWRWRVAALLNDDATPVGAVHVGVVCVVEPGPGTVAVREADRMSGRFETRRDLLALLARERETFESWSALVLDRIDEVLAWARPHASFTPTPSGTPTSTT